MSPTALADRLARLTLIGMAGGAMIGVPSAYALLASPLPAIAEAASGVAAGQPMPDDAIVEADAASPGTIGRAADGMFYARLSINGHDTRCLVDTGASALVLDAARARRMGVSGGERFTGRVLTAGGERAAARGRIAHVHLAGRAFREVPAVIVRGSASPCLLGQELLARMERVEFRGDELRLD